MTVLTKRTAALAAMLLGGCASFNGLGAPDAPVAGLTQTVNVVQSDFCALAKKRTWDVNDTPATIDEARRENAVIDKRCGVPGAAARTAPTS